MKLAFVLVALALSASAQTDQPELLSELRGRGVIKPEATSWTADDMKLLDRIQRDEAAALELLGKQFGDERALVGRGYLRGPVLHRHLTKEGDERYRQLYSQEAVHFFEGKGLQLRDMFAVKDATDHPLFDADGRLTDEGFFVYGRAAAGQPVQWKGGDGKLYGAAPAPPKPAEPVTPWRSLYLLTDSRGQGVWWPYYEGHPPVFFRELEGSEGAVDYPGVVPGQPFSAEDCFVNTAVGVRGALTGHPDLRVLGFKDHGCTGRLQTMRWWKMSPSDERAAAGLTQAELDSLAPKLEAYFRSINVLH
jgi:hypothetical protein